MSVFLILLLVMWLLLVVAMRRVGTPFVAACRPGRWTAGCILGSCGKPALPGVDLQTGSLAEHWIWYPRHDSRQRSDQDRFWRGRRRAVLNALGKKLRQRLLLAAPDRTLKAEQQTRIAALNTRAVRKLQDLAKMDPEDFEYWVAGYFKKRRIRSVVVTQLSHDKGIDIFMKTPKGHEAVAQVKRYNKPIGRPVVQQTLGAMHVAEAEHGYVVTNNRFTRDALAIAQKCPRVVHLIDGAQLLAAV